MTNVTVTRTISASVERVFQGVADVAGLPATNPDILDIEFLSQERVGVGVRFRETRRTGKQSAIIEYDAPRRMRMVADSHGIVWDTTFSVRATEAGTVLTVSMDCRAHALLPKLLNPLMKGRYRKGPVTHVDALQSWCER